MYKDTGYKIQIFARLIIVLHSLLWVYFAYECYIKVIVATKIVKVVGYMQYEETSGNKAVAILAAIGVFLVGVMVSYFLSLLINGFGLIVEKTEVDLEEKLRVMVPNKNSKVKSIPAEEPHYTEFVPDNDV